MNSKLTHQELLHTPEEHLFRCPVTESLSSVVIECLDNPELR